MKPATIARKLQLIATALAFAATAQLHAQLQVSAQTDLQQLARTITGPGVIISNPQINCHPQGYGQFQYSGPLLGIDEGILLTTGTIQNTVGPNDVENKTFQQNRPGNPILNTVTGRTTYDACMFEFDVIPAGDSLRFDFVFGSEEYNEWVGSQYNDVFGFFISGPGITGDPDIGNDKNIALIPGSNQAVAINNVNNGSNAGYYYDNAGGQYIQYDGFTKGLSAHSVVQPCQTYHLKLVVADASDRKFDSGVFIAKVKSNPVTMQLITANGSDSLVEGCNNGLVRFTRQDVNGQPLTLQYFLHGTAVNGTDYTTIGNPDPNVPKTITIPADQAFVDQPVTVLDDGIAEGSETILFILGNPNCPGAQADTLVVPIVDELHVGLSPASSQICKGGQVQLAASGGNQYAWDPATGLSDPNIADPVAQPTANSTYTVTITKGDCSATRQAVVNVSDMQPTAVITKPLCHGASNGAINLQVVGGIPPYAFQWTGPNGFTATSEDITGIGAGTYTVTITDAVCTKVKSFNVAQPATLTATLTPSLLVFGQHISCHGGNDGSISASATGGVGPYTASWTGPNGFTSSSLNISGLVAGTYSVVITDSHGCTAPNSVTLLESAAMVADMTNVTNVACADGTLGSATLAVSGGMPSYAFSWNTVPVQTTATAVGLAPGTYTATATDQYGCQASGTVTINGPTVPLSLQLTATTHVACHGAGNGSATVQAIGGTPPYNISWNTTPPQAGPAAVGLSPGTYLATVTDANACQAIREVTITGPAQALSLSLGSAQDVSCHGQSTGSAAVSASGGTAPYAYSWNTVPPKTGAAITGLPAGSYTATVNDARGCTAAVQVVIAQPAQALAASISNMVEVSCAGGNDGAATVDVQGGTAPYNIAWNTTPAQTGSTASNLSAGSWRAVITDAKGCTTMATAILVEPAPLTASGTVVPAACQGAASGSVSLHTDGGTPPYQWSWSGPAGFTANPESIGGLEAGGYTVLITDGNGCHLTRSFNVNQPGLFEVSSTITQFGNANVSCPGSADGSIALSVTGAVPPYSFTWSGPNGFASVQKDISGLAAGSYTVTISDQNGCSTGLDFTLTPPPAIAVQLAMSDHGGTAISCHGGNNGSLNASITGGNAPYTLAWAGPGGFTSASSGITGLVAGTYELSVTDANGCPAVQSATLAAPALLTASLGGSTPVGCFGNNTGQATVNASGGRAPYSYAWNTSPPQTAATAVGLAAGNYQATVTDANGCSTSLPVTIAGPTAPLALQVMNTNHVLCNGGHTGSATVQPMGGTAPYSIAWNTVPPISGSTANGLPAGTWVATVTDAAGCTAAKTIVVTQPALPISASLSDVHAVSCFGDHDGTATIQISGGSGSYNVVWNTTPAQTGATATDLAVGSHLATITDGNGCTQSVELPVYIPGPMEPMEIGLAPYTYPGGAHTSCPGSTDGSIVATVTGGTPGYSYYWQDGLGNTMTTASLTGLAAGTYHLLVHDGHGCFADTTVVLHGPDQLTASATVASAVCHGSSDGAIQLQPGGGVPPYSYQWTGPSGFTASTMNLAMIPAGVYFVNITDANNCSLDQPFDVTEPGTFTFDATVTPASCSASATGAVNLQASGGTPPYQYAWTGPNGFMASTANISGLLGGTYHLVLIDANDCSALHTAIVPAPSTLTGFVISVKNHGGYDISCAGGADGAINSTFDGGTPPYSYAWSGPGGFTASTPNIDYLVAGTYSLTVIDANGCSRGTSITLVAPPPLTAQATATTYAQGFNISCSSESDGAIGLQPSGGTLPYAVQWNGPGGYTSNDMQITGLQAGTYTAQLTDGNNCSHTVTIVLNAPAPLQANIATTDIACHAGATGAMDLDIQGGSSGYTILWSGPGTFTANGQHLTGLVAGTYNVVVRDANNCQASATAIIAQPSPLLLQAAVTTTACQGANTGAIDLSVSGGTGTYTYQWTGFPAFSANTQDIQELFAGAYTVVVTDAAGCTSATTYNVGEPDLFEISAVLGNTTGGYHVSCPTATDGSIEVEVSGGTGPYNYFWNGPLGFTSITADIDGLAAGQYTLSIHDANGCNASASYTLVAPEPIMVGLVPTAEPGCSNGADGSIAANVTGGVGPYEIAWHGPSGPMGTGNTLHGAQAGQYTVTVTDVLGCQGTSGVILTSPSDIEAEAVPQAMANGHHVSCADASDGSIALSLSGGTAPYLVSWEGPAGYHSANTNITGLQAGTYTALITDANGCSQSAQAVLTAPAPLEVQFTTSLYSGGNQVSCAGAADGSITIAITGGSPDYTVGWTGPGGFQSQQETITGLAPGSYTATVSDNAGCYSGGTVTLVAPPPLTTTATISDHNGFAVGCLGNDGSIELAVGGGLAPYQFQWTGPDGFGSSAQQLEGLQPGSYSVLVSDANNCTAQRSFTLTAPPALQLEPVVTSNECDVAANGEIMLNITGGVAPLAIAWTGPGGFTSTAAHITGLASGQYTATVTTAMGCEASAQATVLAAAPIHLALYASQYGSVNIACHGDSTGVIELSATGGFAPLQYQWQGPNGFVAGTPNINGLVAGTYSILISDARGCVRDSSITLTEPASALAIQLSASDVACHGGATGSVLTTITGGNAPYTFDWRGPDSTSFSTPDIHDLTAGLYELVVTDTNQCVLTSQITIGEPATPISLDYSMADYGGANTSCGTSADGAIHLVAVGGSPAYTYAWTGPNGFTSTADSLSGLAAGSYIITATDSLGCSTSDTIAVVAATPINASILPALLPSGSAISCHGANDGALQGQASGGTGTLQWQWEGPGGFASGDLELGSLAPGTYCFNVTDDNLCTVQACFTIEEPQPLSVAATSLPAPCGANTGAANSVVTGGTAPYQYTWSNGAQTEHLAGIPAGTYTVAVLDANGCTATTAVEVEGSPAVQVESTLKQPLCHNSSEGSIELQVTTGTAPFNITWQDGTTATTLDGLPAGAYSVTVADAMGCHWEHTFVIESPAQLVPDTLLSAYGNGHNVSTWGGHDGWIALNMAGGTPPYSYLWHDGAQASERHGLAAGTYTVTITDANGCTLELTVLLTQPDELEMPTGFTPNGDGHNDLFVVKGIDAWPDNQITIFNRWGNVVYDRLNYQNDWRGENQQGQELPEGTYFVVLRLGSDKTLQNYVDLRR